MDARSIAEHLEFLTRDHNGKSWPFEINIGGAVRNITNVKKVVCPKSVFEGLDQEHEMIERLEDHKGDFCSTSGTGFELDYEDPNGNYYTIAFDAGSIHSIEWVQRAVTA